jgi:hypothetical protein
LYVEKFETLSIFSSDLDVGVWCGAYQKSMRVSKMLQAAVEPPILFLDNGHLFAPTTIPSQKDTWEIPTTPRIPMNESMSRLVLEQLLLGKKRSGMAKQVQ